jgi:hypothetical protein
LIFKYFKFRFDSLILFKNCNLIIKGKIQNEYCFKNLKKAIDYINGISINNFIIGLKNLNKNKNFKKSTDFVKIRTRLKNFSKFLYPLLQKNFNLVKQKFVGKTDKKIFTINNSLKLASFYSKEKNNNNLLKIISIKTINFLKKENNFIYHRNFKHKNRGLTTSKEGNKKFIKKKISSNRFQRFDKLIEYITPEWESENDDLKTYPISKILTNEIKLI